jgi:hypothetical protein
LLQSVVVNGFNAQERIFMHYAMRAIFVLGTAVACLAAESSAPQTSTPSASQTSTVTPAPEAAPPAPPEVKPAIPPPAPASVLSGIKFSGWGWFTMGRTERSKFEKDNYDVNFEKEWLIDYDAGIKMVAPMPHGWNSRFHLGMTTAYPVLDPKKRDAEFLRRKLALYMIDAAMDKTIKAGDNSFFLEAGFFPVRYNPQAMNLGEYLYRSGTYPQYLISGFELADKEKLTGIHFQYKRYFATDGCLKADAYITSGMRDFPIHDISPSILVAVTTPRKFLEIGLGTEFSHLIGLDERKVTPATDTVLFMPGTPEFRNVGWIDTTNSQDTTIHVRDTIKYTYRGVKTIARIMFDPAAFFTPSFRSGAKLFLGKEDLKLYGEIAVLGWKNYPGWYKNFNERVPAMFGFNCPTFQPFAYSVVPAILAYNLTEGETGLRTGRMAAYGLGGLLVGGGFMLLDMLCNIDTKADVLALEGQYFNYKYINSSENVWRNRGPVPYTGQRVPDYRTRGTEWYNIEDDNWKWSVYASKKLFTCLRVSAQVASDHLQRTMYMFGPPQSSKYTEIVPRTKDWYWMTRVMYYF